MNYDTFFLGGSLIIGLGGFIGLWYLSQHTPRGTVLAISIGLYLLSYVFGPIPIRELKMLGGLLGMLGFGGGILGILDLAKPRKVPSQPQEASENQELSGQDSVPPANG